MTILITHEACLRHEMTPGHPERPARLVAVLSHLREIGLLDDVTERQAPAATRADVERIHGKGHLERLQQLTPTTGLTHLDPDTALCPHSLRAARVAAGAVVAGVDAVLDTDERRVFAAVRPPGHHAEESTAMGFCLLNGVAMAAAHALARPEVERVAILDFDVHHGNGTVAAFRKQPRVLVCSSFQFPHYPYRLQNVRRPNIVNTPLPAGATGAAFRRAVERDWLPALETFRPELILVSAGFDAHAEDPLGDLLLGEDDFTWVTRFIVDAARRFARGRVVSVLEGGYHLDALARSTAAHVAALAVQA